MSERTSPQIGIVVVNGSLSQRAEGSWRASFYYTDGNGRRQRKYRTVHARSASEAKVRREYERIRLQEELNEGSGSALAGAKEASERTFLEASREYMEYRRATNAVEAATLKRNLSDSNRAAAIHDVPVGEVTPRHVEDMIVGLVEAGFSATTVRGTVTYVSQVFKHLVVRGALDRNPCYGVRKPKPAKRKVQYLTREHRAKLLRILSEADETRFTVAVYIAYYTGMRRGEVCALMWDDVDFAKDMIRVTRAIGAASAEYVKAPKTDSMRTVPLCANLKRVLLSWRTRYPQDVTGMYLLGEPVPGNRWPSPGNVTKEWRFFCDMHKLGRYTFHALRHTFAQALLVEERVDPVTVAAILGHADVSVTLNTYSAPDEGQKLAAIPVIDAIGAAAPPTC